MAGEAKNRLNDHAGTSESAAFFRAVLDELGETQSSFARKLARLGDDRKPATILRHVQRMATGEARISGEMKVILTIFRKRRERDKAKEAKNAALEGDLRGAAP
jgi:hypothetical protein